MPRKKKVTTAAVLVPIPNCHQTTVAVCCPTGSRHEDKTHTGVAHLLEHALFLGCVESKKHDRGLALDSGANINMAVAQTGGKSNAFTTYDQTVYHITVPSSNPAATQTAIAILCAMILRPTLDPEKLANESKVVLEEIRKYKDLEGRAALEQLLSMIFKGKEMEHDIAGSEAHVKQLGADRKYVHDFYKKHYHPSRLHVVVCGGVNERDRSDVAASFAHSGMPLRWLQLSGGGNPPFHPHPTPPPITFPAMEGAKQHRTIKQTAQTHVAMGFPMAIPAGDASKRALCELLNQIAGGWVGSRLWRSIRGDGEKRGLAYSVDSDLDFFEECMVLTVSTALNNAKVDEGIKKMGTVLDGMKDDLRPEEVHHALTTLLGGIDMKRGSSMQGTLRTSETLLYTGVPHKDQLRNELAALQQEDTEDLIDKLQTLAKEYLISTNCYVTCIGPSRKSAKSKSKS